MRGLSGAAVLTALLVLSSVVLAQADDGSGVALPVEGKMQLWDMQAEPPRRISEALPDQVSAGSCYSLSGTVLTDQGKTCLSYYVTDAQGDQAAFRVTGKMSFDDQTPDLAYRGLRLTEASGMADCGERDDCQTLYIAGFRTDALVDKAVELARNGCGVTLAGKGIFNLESVDLIVDAIEVP